MARIHVCPQTLSHTSRLVNVLATPRLPIIPSLDFALQLSGVSLQLIFTDGEEAFKSWTSTDSLYGARQLAADMNVEGGLLSVGDKTGIEAMEAFILLDLIGSTDPHPVFHNHYEPSSNLFQRMAKIGELYEIEKNAFKIPVFNVMPCVQCYAL